MPETSSSHADVENVRGTVREYAERRLRPLVDQMDESREFPLEIVKELGDLGFLGIGFPEEFGGSGGTKLEFAVAVEEIYRLSAGLAASTFMSPLIAHDILLSNSSREAKKRLVPPILAGEMIAALAVTEPEAGSDAGAIRTSAKRVEGGWKINGYKRFITNANISDLVLVLARTTANTGNKGLTLFAVPKGTPGLVPQRQFSKVGWRCSDTADIAFDECTVPDDAVVGEVDGGFKCVMNGFNLERIVLATGSVGLGQAALDASVSYVSQRVQFGQLIGTFQSVRESVARMAADVEAARQLSYFAAREMDAGRPCAKEASMAKLVAGEMAQRVTMKSIQLHGGSGFTMEVPVQRFHRDSLIMTIGGGTSEIQSELIARTLGLPR